MEFIVLHSNVRTTRVRWAYSERDAHLDPDYDD